MPVERGLYSDDTARLIDDEIKQIITGAHNEARRILRDVTSPLAAGGGQHGHRRGVRNEDPGAQLVATREGGLVPLGECSESDADDRLPGL